MKKMMSVMVAFMIIGVTTVLAINEKTETFAVKGNCGMCEKTIEKAAIAVEGVRKAEWDKVEKMITVTFNESKTTLDDIHKAIAKSGYDTYKVKAEDTVYNKLPSCCQYDRGKESSKE